MRNRNPARQGFKSVDKQGDDEAITWVVSDLSTGTNIVKIMHQPVYDPPASYTSVWYSTQCLVIAENDEMLDNYPQKSIFHSCWKLY